MKTTKKNFIKYLNEIGIHEDDKKSNGGRIPDHANYGQWLYKNDTVAFNVGFRDWSVQ